ncbi:hypothetical protein Amet_2141 [Alkaliphilus metalliredigens QYMF]|uniref:Uncharacterized protein n=1 Tax=Alkaliphilus metalliredigens (strain QYMF) TaxID=293826 RepID=A6TQ32_ALKMQ|nr:hypothetical protein [Alkaliphilus metalliredigens]ABR48300.1 hypothetical protein Amet_2141 [Alkaliphilus metalliredigens QYMF]
MKDVKVITLQEAIKGMNEEELERFKKERYEKFIKPLMGLNMKTTDEVEKISQGEASTKCDQ